MDAFGWAGVPGRGAASGDDVRGFEASCRREVRSRGTRLFAGAVGALPGLRGPIGLRPESVEGGERARAMSMVASKAWTELVGQRDMEARRKDDKGANGVMSDGCLGSVFSFPVC